MFVLNFTNVYDLLHFHLIDGDTIVSVYLHLLKRDVQYTCILFPWSTLEIIFKLSNFNFPNDKGK